MPYKDKDKQREANRLCVQRLRARQKALTEMDDITAKENDRILRSATAVDKRETVNQEFVRVMNDLEYRESLGLNKIKDIMGYFHIGTVLYYKWIREMGLPVRSGRGKCNRTKAMKKIIEYQKRKEDVIESLVKIIKQEDNPSPRYFELFIKLTEDSTLSNNRQTNKSRSDYFDDSDDVNRFDIGSFETAEVVEIKA